MEGTREKKLAAPVAGLLQPWLETILKDLVMGFVARLGEHTYTIEIEEIEKSHYKVAVDGNEFLVDGKKTGRTNYSLIVGNRSFEIEVDHTGDEYRILVDGRSYHIDLIDEKRLRSGGADSGTLLHGAQSVMVPMPGKVIAVLVSEGDPVEAGQGLLIIEAMKMENEVRSPVAGTIKEIRVKPGESVEGGKVLVTVA